jgi:hypothetical protein
MAKQRYPASSPSQAPAPAASAAGSSESKPLSLKEAVDEGRSLREAHAVVAEQEALASGQAPDQAKEAADAALAVFDEVHNAKPSKNAEKRLMYRVHSPREFGFWRIGRHFGRKPTLLDPDTLTAEQVKALEGTPRLYLVTELVEV